LPMPPRHVAGFPHVPLPCLLPPMTIALDLRVVARIWAEFVAVPPDRGRRYPAASRCPLSTNWRTQHSLALLRKWLSRMIFQTRPRPGNSCRSQESSAPFRLAVSSVQGGVSRAHSGMVGVADPNLFAWLIVSFPSGQLQSPNPSLQK